MSKIISLIVFVGIVLIILKLSNIQTNPNLTYALVSWLIVEKLLGDE